MFLHLKPKNFSQKSWSDMPDERLVDFYLSDGNKDLIAILFERYTHLVYGICLNYLQDSDQCKDAVMEIFESLFQKLADHKVNNFRNWLYSVTRNHCLMLIRKTGSLNRLKNHIKEEESGTELPIDPDGEDDLLFSKAKILLAVDNLNHEQCTCIKLMYIEDKSYKEISEMTGFAINEVKSYIQNGKRNLKNYLLRQNGTTEA
jgi:RNA polymerase sigma factor (sigma-70 family)